MRIGDSGEDLWKVNVLHGLGHPMCVRVVALLYVKAEDVGEPGKEACLRVTLYRPFRGFAIAADAAAVVIREALVLNQLLNAALNLAYLDSTRFNSLLLPRISAFAPVLLFGTAFCQDRLNHPTQQRFLLFKLFPLHPQHANPTLPVIHALNSLRQL